MRKQPKSNRFIDEILVWVIIAGGFLLAVYCVWLQSGGISVASGQPVISWGFIYFPLLYALGVLLAGALAGYGIIVYFKSEVKKSEGISHLTPIDFLYTARGLIILFPLSALLGFLMTEVLWVLIGVFGMFFSSFGLLFYRLWVRQWEKGQDGES